MAVHHARMRRPSLDRREATGLLSEFAGRMEQPLRHLLCPWSPTWNSPISTSTANGASRRRERFDVINPATEEVLASVASADIADADAALDAAEAAMKDWAARTPRERSEVLRKAWELMTARLDDFAHLITLENGKAGVDAKGEADLCRRVLPLVRRRGGARRRHDHPRPRLGRAHHGAAQARRAGRAGHAVELPRRHGHPQDRPGAGRGLRRDHQARLGNAADHAGADAAAGRGGRAAGPRQRAAPRKTGALVDHMLHDPRVRVVSFTGSTGVGRSC